MYVQRSFDNPIALLIGKNYAKNEDKRQPVSAARTKNRSCQTFGHHHHKTTRAIEKLIFFNRKEITYQKNAQRDNAENSPTNVSHKIRHRN